MKAINYLLFFYLILICGCSADKDIDVSSIQGQETPFATVLKYYKSLLISDEQALKECWWQDEYCMKLAECDFHFYQTMMRYRLAIENKFGVNSWSEYDKIDRNGIYIEFLPIDDLEHVLELKYPELYENKSPGDKIPVKLLKDAEFQIVKYQNKFFLRLPDEFYSDVKADRNSLDFNMAFGEGAIAAVKDTIKAMESSELVLTDCKKGLLPEAWNRIVELDTKDMSLAEVKELSGTLIVIKTKPSLDKYWGK